MRAYHACPCACLSYHAQYWLQYICARRYAYSISLTNTHTHWYTYTHIHTYTYTQRVCIHTTRMSMRGLSCIHHLTRLPISPKASRFYEGQTANLTAVWRVKGHIGLKKFLWNNFRMAKSWSHVCSRIWKCSFHSAVLWGFEHRKGVYQNLGKTSKNVKLESLVTMEGWEILPVKSNWTMNISAIFCQTAKSSGRL